MKKIFTIQNLDCGHCAQKIEDRLSNLEHVQSARVNFIMQTLTIEAEDVYFQSVMDEAVKVAKKIEPDCEIMR